METKKTIQEIQTELSACLKVSNISLRRGGGKAPAGKIFVLFYKDARVDFERLNEVVGCFGWKREHNFIDGKNYCTVSIKNPETGEWVGKQDVGTESNTEAEKGQSSDAFKRACFNWGIGLELYNMPKVMLSDAYQWKLNELELNIAYFKEDPTIPAVVVIKDGATTLFSYKHKNYDPNNKAAVYVP